MTQELDTEAPERRSATVSSEASAETETELRIELAKLMISTVTDAEWPISPSDVLGPLTKAELVRCVLESVEDAADEGQLWKLRVRLRRGKKAQVLALVLSLCEENFAD